MRIIEELGNIHRGGFGVIDKVRTEDGSILARKTFSPIAKDRMDVKTFNDLKRRFSREVKVQERLPSEYFIPILFSSLEEDEPWFLMPVADKVFTQEILDARNNRTIPNGLADVLNCLEYLHDLDYVHRDLKPGNILYHEGKWKLADLGLITSDSQLTSSYQTSEGFWAGSEQYMAPEQHNDFRNVTHQADIYSFGALLHDIFVKKKRIPYKRQTAKGHIGSIIQKCTEEKIKKRFDNVRVLRNVLLPYLSKISAGGEDVSEDVEAWIDKFNKVYEWNEDEFDSFMIYIESNEEARKTLFWEIDNDKIESLHKLDPHLWKLFILLYCERVSTKHFDFDYCDVVIGYLYNAYNLTTDLEVKSSIVLASAELGWHHNRWYVMRFVIKMSSPDISENLAKRINIEIHASGDRAKSNLQACVRQINHTISSYHPEIQKALM